MIRQLFNTLKQKERAWRHSKGKDISTPEMRRDAIFHYRYIDHGVLRALWKNFHKVAEGVYRSNQPSPHRLAEFKAMGVKTVLNLRGSSLYSQYLLEVEACENLGLTLIDHRMYGTSLPTRDELLALLALFKTIEKPFVMHCKSGADRTGFVSVIYLHVVCGDPVPKALRELNWRYLHFRKSKFGILDLFFDTYMSDSAATGISMIDWISEVYDQEALIAQFKQQRGK